MDGFNPKISIIIPVYNGANYLREAIDSALAQTYKNIEIIVVNDGSKDDGKTEAIARSYGDRIQYFCKINGGVATALNMGIEKMTGEYFSWLSHDDLYFPDKIMEQVKILRDRNDRNVILYGNYLLIDANGKQIGLVEHDTRLLNEKPLYSLLRGCIHGCTLLVPQCAFKKFGLFDERLRTTQDYDLWFKMRAGYRFVHVPQVLIKSRCHSEQDTKKNSATIREANALWIGFHANLSKEELSTEKTVFLFLKGMADFLESTPYKDALIYYRKEQQREYERVLRQIEDIKVTAIMPFYNRIAWTKGALESVCNQTHRKLEIILIDNNSNDEYDSIIELANRDERIVILREPRQGVSYARNRGMQHASGKYLAFIDSDDLWIEDKIEKQLLYMELHGIEFSHTWYRTFDSCGREYRPLRGTREGYLFPEIIGMCSIATPTVMLKKAIIDEYNLCFKEELHIGEDVCLWIQVAHERYIGYLDEALTKVRLHGTNAAFDSRKSIIGLINIISFVLNKYDFDIVIDNVNKLLHAVFIKSNELRPNEFLLPRQNRYFAKFKETKLGIFLRQIKRKIKER